MADANMTYQLYILLELRRNVSRNQHFSNAISYPIPVTIRKQVGGSAKGSGGIMF